MSAEIINFSPQPRLDRIIDEMLKQQAYNEPFRAFVIAHINTRVNRIKDIPVALTIPPDVEALPIKKREEIIEYLKAAPRAARIRVWEKMVAEVVGAAFHEASVIFQARQHGL